MKYLTRVLPSGPRKERGISRNDDAGITLLCFWIITVHRWYVNIRLHMDQYTQLKTCTERIPSGNNKVTDVRLEASWRLLIQQCTNSNSGLAFWGPALCPLYKHN
jgi:hypothetical protein